MLRTCESTPESGICQRNTSKFGFEGCRTIPGLTKIISNSDFTFYICLITHHDGKEYGGVDFFTMAQQPPVGQGVVNIEASRSHSDTPHSVGLLWTRDQPDTQTST